MIGGLAATAGAATYLAGTVVEVASVPSAVRAYNRAHAATMVTLAPLATPTGVVPGIALSGRF